jgi:tetratricopeptide (TPR) repeat protein
LWQQLGLLGNGQTTRRLYTPAMLAELFDLPSATIRRWHRSGLIQPLHTVGRLPYFAYEEIVVARRLVELAENGASHELIASQQRSLQRHWPDVTRPLSELSLQIEGRRLLVRRNGVLLEPHGQLRFDFSSSPSSDDLATIPLRGSLEQPPQSVEQLVAQAEEFEDAGEVEAAAELYRSALLASGPNAQICFQLGECLYRLNDLAAARERYAMAVELDARFLEARVSLGCVLAELKQTELAIAALEGALAQHADYADAHYHLARLLSAAGRSDEGQAHAERFQELSPASPWLSQATPACRPKRRMARGSVD